MSQRVGINYERDGREVRGLAAWRVLEHFGGQADEDVLESVKKGLPVALKDFPALAHETINVGVLYENADAHPVRSSTRGETGAGGDGCFSRVTPQNS